MRFSNYYENLNIYLISFFTLFLVLFTNNIKKIMLAEFL